VIRHRGHWTPQDRVEATYRYLPFDVPPGTQGITVRYRYARAADAILDLGVADPERVRGWSGSQRDAVVIGPRTATPGYLPGPLPAGEWQVILGLYRLPADGLAFEVEVELGAAEPRAATYLRRSGGNGWPATSTRTQSTPTGRSRLRR